MPSIELERNRSLNVAALNDGEIELCYEHANGDVCIYLTPSEAVELRDGLTEILHED